MNIKLKTKITKLQVVSPKRSPKNIVISGGDWKMMSGQQTEQPKLPIKKK